MNRAPILIPMTLLMSVSLAAATAADATPRNWEPEQRSELVRYGDLDLTSPSGQRTFDRRIEQAINRVCDRGDVNDLQSAMDERRCRSDARAAAHAQRSRAVASANAGSIQLSGGR